MAMFLYSKQTLKVIHLVKQFYKVFGELSKKVGYMYI